MIKTNLLLVQVLSLSIELQSLVKEDLAYKTKYWLNKLISITSKEAEEYEKIRIEMVNKYGRKNDEGIMYVDESTDEFGIFMKEINDILSQKIDIEHSVFDVNDFEFKSENNYPVFDLLIQV